MRITGFLTKVQIWVIYCELLVLNRLVPIDSERNVGRVLTRHCRAEARPTGLEERSWLTAIYARGVILNLV